MTTAVLGGDRSAWAAVAELERDGIGCVVVWSPDNPASGPSGHLDTGRLTSVGDLGSVAGLVSVAANSVEDAAAQVRSRVDTSRAVSVGATTWDCGLAAASVAHFHVGAGDKIPGKVAGLVPLSGQGRIGLANVLQWIRRLRSTDGMEIVDYHDIVRFAEESSRAFHRATTTRAAADRAWSLAERIRAEFPETEAVIGGGFPFYSVDIDRNGSVRYFDVPASITRYIDTQRNYFRTKVIPGWMPDDLVATRDELRSYGLEADRNVFDVYEYAREGVKPGEPGPARGTFAQFVSANELDRSADLWPCHFCTDLHDVAKFPEQAFIKDFMHSCTLCRQTTLIPRNVGGVSCDVDVVAVADVDPGERDRLGRRMADWVDAEPSVFRYDTDVKRAIVDGDGPADVFVASAHEFWTACDQIATGHAWHDVTLLSSALWLPITEHRLELGLNFALCVEPLTVQSPEWMARFDAIRRGFAATVTGADVVARLRTASFYHEQLMSNDDVPELVRLRMRRWSDEPNPAA